jgi:hypothetical protein
MYISGVQEYAREVVSAEPNPPRRVSLWTLVRRSYANSTSLLIVGFGLVLGLPLLAIMLLAPVERDGWWIGMLAFVIPFTTLMAAVPLIYAWRMWRALMGGSVARAEVIRVAFSGPSLRPETIDAQRHGMARGTWRVQRAGGPFEASFECNAGWASQLQGGTEVRVIIDATRPRVLLDLGPVLTGERP